MLQKLKQIASRNLVNIPGWRTDRKIVVFESDDWGSIRMPSRELYQKLLAKGIRVDQSLYDTYDTLENREDLTFLLDLLIGYKDKKGRHPIFTLNTVMGNPAFNRIKEDHFDKYYHEDISTSYKRFNGDDILDIWFRAIDEELIFPQFHAREHLNVSLWMDALQRNHQETKIAFNHKFFALKTKFPFSHQNNFLAAYWAEDKQDFEQKVLILKSGLEMFHEKFGFPSTSFVACNYVYSEIMEKSMLDFGIKYIQTQRGHISPDIYTGKKKIKRNFTGQISSFNQFYMVRNCFFEPTLNPNKDSMISCLKEIETAFKWNKPAIISSHRVNYVGGLSNKNREQGLQQLESLLTHLLNRWPDVEFFTSVDLGNLIENEI